MRRPKLTKSEVKTIELEYGGKDDHEKEARKKSSFAISINQGPPSSLMTYDCIPSNTNFLCN